MNFSSEHERPEDLSEERQLAMSALYMLVQHMHATQTPELTASISFSDKVYLIDAREIHKEKDTS